MYQVEFFIIKLFGVLSSQNICSCW